MWQVSISTTAEAEEAVVCFLERAFQKAATVYLDHRTGATNVTVFPNRLAGLVEATHSQLRSELRRIGECGLNFAPGKITIKPLPKENWAESWKRHFKPIEIGNALLIKPGWSKRKPRPGQRVVILNPGLSFGTGQHPTTLYCLQRLVECRRAGEQQSFLDIGTGSGILAIAAAKLGYSPIDAFDFDPAAVRVSGQNVRRNRVAYKVQPHRADLTKMKIKNSARSDVICANLVCDLLASEASRIHALLKPGGKLIVAGVLGRQFGALQKYLRQFNLTLEDSMSDKPWKSGQFVRL